MTETKLTSRSHAKTGLEFAMDDEDLAIRQTVYRSDLMANKRVLVSGAGTGIGKATALLFARLGADVAICGRRQEQLDEAASFITRVSGRSVMTRAMDIREPDEVEGLMTDIHKELGGLDVLVNNAGGQFVSNAQDISRKGWRAVIDTNLNGTWWMMQEAAKQWISREQPGSIINVVIPVERGCPQVAHSCAARAGVIYSSKTVAVEWAPHNIRVNCLAVGVTKTEGFRQYPEDFLRNFETCNPMMRMSDPFEMAEAMVFMSSSAAAFMTGELLHLDGGQSMWGTGWLGGRPEWFGPGPG